MGLNKSKFSVTRVKNCMRTFLVHLFSHVGLCVLVVGYAVAGGFLFELIESKSEKDNVDKRVHEWLTVFNDSRRNHSLNLWKITERLNVLHEENWTQEVERELDRFGMHIANIAKDNKEFIGNEPQWTFPRALMYSVSIITTIGYGNTAPQTTTGKILTIFYAIIGVPLMLLWVSNIGNLMANTFKFAYAHGPCRSSSKKSSNRKHINKSSNPTVQASSGSFNRKGSTKSTKSAKGPPEASATQVQYSVNERKCETRLLEPSTKIRRKGHGGTGTIQGLTAGAKQVLLECAEYNVSQGQDERSRRILEQLQVPEDSIMGETSVYPPPPGEDDSPDQSDVESVIDLHINMMRIRASNDDDERVHPLECYPYPPCPYPFYDTTTTSSTLPHPPSGGGILRKPSVTGPQVKKTVSLIESCPTANLTPSRIPLITREETCPDLVDIERFSIDSNMGTGDGVGVVSERVPTTLVLSIVVIYILAGAGAFRYLEGWDFYDSAYFCFITLSTIGLGDFTPSGSLKIEGMSSNSEIYWVTARIAFCCLYLVLGLAIIAMSFSLVQEDLTIRMKNMARRFGIIGEYD